MEWCSRVTLVTLVYYKKNYSYLLFFLHRYSSVGVQMNSPKKLILQERTLDVNSHFLLLLFIITSDSFKDFTCNYLLAALSCTLGLRALIKFQGTSRATPR